MTQRRKKEKNEWVLGIDEAGRGPLAGPVAVGGVWYQKKDEPILRKQFVGIRDSKKLSAKQRDLFFKTLRNACREGRLHYAVGYAAPKTIDGKGIVHAIRLGMRRMIRKIEPTRRNTEVLLDGSLSAPSEFPNQRTIVGGDNHVFAIQLASVVAKVCRDRLMRRADKRYPDYGFSAHKGYGTKEHFEALKRHGTSDLHRKSFLSEK